MPRIRLLKQEWLELLIIMRPSSLGGGRILRCTLSVCLSVCLSVRPVTPVLVYIRTSVTCFRQPCGRVVSFVLFTCQGRIQYSDLSRTSLLLYYEMYWLEWRCHSITVAWALNNETENWWEWFTLITTTIPAAAASTGHHHRLLLLLLHCVLASCSAVYCNRSCLWVCDSGRCPNLTAVRACAAFASLWAFLSLYVCLFLFMHLVNYCCW